MNKIDIKCVAKDGVKVPVYKTAGAAGADVCAYLEEVSEKPCKKQNRVAHANPQATIVAPFASIEKV